MLAGALTLSAAIGTGVVAGPAAAGDGTAAAPRAPEAPARPIAVQAGPIAGTIVALDGKTPVPGARVLVFDREGRKVAEATTGEAGRFDLPALAAGEYRFEVGKAAGLLRLEELAKATSLMLLVPAEIARAIRDAQEEENTVSVLGVEMPTTTAGAIGIGVFAAASGGLAYGLYEADQSHGGGGAAPAPVSPTNP